MHRTTKRDACTALFTGSAAAVLATLLGACATDDRETEPPLVSLSEATALTDINDDPRVVEVVLVAAAATVEYIRGKPTQVWAYRDGAVAGSVGTVPGPMLRARLGDEVIVHFKNELSAHTTVHFHGPRLPPFADGSHVSQHAIHPGESFDYRFVVKDAGSFWYHPHVHGYDQIERGLYGPVVFEGGVIPVVTADRYLVLDDVKLGDDGQLPDELSDSDRRFGRQGNVFLVNGQHAPLALQIQSGTRERWRLVNAANGRYFNLHIPNLRFLVIATDGGLLPAPYWTDTLLIVPGERYDVLVTFTGKPGTRRQLETIAYDRGQTDAQGGPQRLLVIDQGPAGTAPPDLPTVWRDLPGLPSTPATPVRRFVLGERELAGGALFFTINDEVWPDNAAVELKRDDVEIWDIRNDSPQDHPMHVHGAFFEVLARANGKPIAHRGWKDTINVPGRSSVRFAIRFETRGIWMLHCHILEHLDTGMLVNVIVHD